MKHAESMACSTCNYLQLIVVTSKLRFGAVLVDYMCPLSILVDLAVPVGSLYSPMWEARRATLIMAFFALQLADFESVIIYTPLPSSHSLTELLLATAAFIYIGHCARLSLSALCWQLRGGVNSLSNTLGQSHSP